MQRLNRYTFHRVVDSVLLNSSEGGGCADSGSGSGNDAGTDANTCDASNIRGDNDGYPQSGDCYGDAFYPGTALDCNSDCNNGSQVWLANGVWIDLPVRMSCSCPPPAKSRIVECFKTTRQTGVRYRLCTYTRTPVS